MPRQQVMVGRDTELAGILGLLAGAADARPGVGLVSGEGGAGKTRLLDEVLERLPSGTAVGRGTGVGFLGGRIPYAPLISALRSLLSRLDEREQAVVLAGARGDLALLLPELGPRQEFSDQARLIAAVSSLLDRVAALRPAVLVLDDMHWADVATLEVLAYVCAALDRQRLAVVVALRPDEVDSVLGEWLTGVRHGRHVLEIALGPMSLADTRTHLTDILGGDPRSVLGESMTARIHVRSGGNPYAAEALMRAALAGDEDTLPASLREVLVRRTRNCPPGTAELLRLVAAIGDRALPSFLALLVPSGPGPEFDDAVDEAVRAQLLVVDAEGGLTIRHALLAEALYADLLPGERRAVHAQLAKAFEVAADVRPGVVAEHADRAGESQRALIWSLRAAEAAEAVYAYDEAHRQYSRVRTLWPAVPDAQQVVGADPVEVFSRAAAVAAICDEDGQAIEIIERVRSWLQADPDVDPVRVGLLEAQYARFLLDGGRTDAALVAARRAVELVPAQPPTAARGMVVSCLVHVLDWAGGGPGWEELADEAVQVARATGDGAAVARALVIRTTVQVASPTVLPDAREAVALALRHGDSELVGQTYSNLVDCLHCAGLGREGVEVAATGLVAVSERGLGIRYGSWLRTQGAELAMTHGWWGEADDLLEAALAHTGQTVGANRDYALAVRSVLHAQRGDFAQSEADLAAMHRLPVVLEILRCRARCERLLWEGASDDALRIVSEFVDSATPRLLRSAAPLAWLASWALADVADARRRTGSGAPTGAGWDATVAAVDELVATACGPSALPGTAPGPIQLLCVAERSRHAAVSDVGVVPSWEAATDALCGAERPYELAYALWRQAGALVAERRLGLAADALRRADSEARSLGALPLADAIEAMARRTRIDLRAPQTVDAVLSALPTNGSLTVALTEREREILGHLAAGRTNGEIAKSLTISTKTASVHVSNILRKLDVASRYEAAEIAQRYLVD